MKNGWFFLFAVENDRIHGVVAMEMSTGRLEVISAKVVVLATGGYGRIFPQQ